MNNIPKIIVDSGFEVDQNGALTEIDIPSAVTTLNAPRKVAFNGTALSWIPSTAGMLQEFVANNVTSLLGNTFKGYTALISVSMPELVSMTMNVSSSGDFHSCTQLQSVSMPKLTSITQSANVVAGSFYGCSSLTDVNMPLLTSMVTVAQYSGAFYNCTGLVSINLPRLASTSDTQSNSGAFYGCTSLHNVVLGSEGHAVTTLSSRTFNGCTQAGLTITIYTNGGAALSGEPWGATNADTDIVYEVA